ncbi:MAG: GNAT family N-acetyltransferase [Hyphomicrobiales bacterium]|nr:GNAT family N-acetyltransferase [Hyphomicrobiales bacterium]
MNVHKPVSASSFARRRASIHPLDHTGGHALCARLSVFMPTAGQIARLMDRAREAIPVPLAANQTVQRVAAANPDAFWAIARRKQRADIEPPEPRGLVAMLMLTAEGVDALLCGRLDARNPPHRFLVGQHERPAAIYGWLIHARGSLAPGLSLVMDKLQAPLYRGVDILCRASTKDGAAFFDALGFSRGVWWDGELRGEFRHYRRSHEGAGSSEISARLRAPFDDRGDRKRRNAPERRAKASIVHNFEEMQKVFAIRSAVYLEEQECPFGEEFDGNDFSGSHLLASIGDAPCGCARLRYFGDFVKIERLAVLRRNRHAGVGKKLVTAAVEFSRAKGYRRAYAHARKSILPFWLKLGFTQLADAPSFSFSDYEYVEVIRELEPAPGALELGAGPLVLIRPEGQWDRPGVLERSADRAAN